MLLPSDPLDERNIMLEVSIPGFHRKGAVRLAQRKLARVVPVNLPEVPDRGPGAAKRRHLP
eukprot:531984-Prorocentrum_minimum.AAC.1